MMCWLRKAALFIGTTMAPATLSVLEAYAGTFAAREQSATGQSMAFAAKAHQTWAECHVLGPRSGDVNERRLDRDACHWGVLQFDDRHIARDLASACGATGMVPLEAGYDRAEMIQPAVMAPPLNWLLSDAAGGVTGRRFLAVHWDPNLPPDEAAAKAGAPVAWTEIATMPIEPPRRG